MKNKTAKLKSKRKGSENVFGCDLTEHLQSSGQDVPHVLRICAEFIEKHGIVDGIYRLSGITSNIQKLRQEFCSGLCPGLTNEVYLQDIHCVGSLCKLYFRELPNPLLTYQLYKKFTDAMSIKEQQEQLQSIRSAVKELPVSHFRTLEYLTKHLAYLATLSHQTNMHTRNLALVWAPNLLRSKEVEEPSCNGDIAFQEVRVQQSVVEFILNHTEQIFSLNPQPLKPREGLSMPCVEKYATLPANSQCGMKLMSLEEAQARSLSPNHPVMRERQRENSLPDSSSAAMYHTVINLSDGSRKLSGKSKKWKSIFSLGRSVMDSKAKLSRNGSVFMRAQNPSEKSAIRPSKSMDSLCSFQAPDEEKIQAEGNNGMFIPILKSRTLGSDIDFSLNPDWTSMDPPSASGGFINDKQGVTSSTLPKPLPEQLKVFKGDDRSSYQPTSPKNRRMLYSGSANNSAPRPSFPGSLFPMESSPRYQRKALNISEPFAVSVPLRVSAVINSNSTPCRAPIKERERDLGALFKPNKEGGGLEGRCESVASAGSHVPFAGSLSFTDWEDRMAGKSGMRENLPGDNSGGSRSSIYSNRSVPVENEDSTGGHKNADACTKRTTKKKDAEEKELTTRVERLKHQSPSEAKTREEELETTSVEEIHKLDKLEVINKVLPSSLLQNGVTTNVFDEHVKPKKTGIQHNPRVSAQARRSSLPPNTVSSKGLFIDLTKNVTFDHSGATSFNTVIKHTPERLLSCDGSWNYLDNDADRPTCMSQNIVTTNLQLSPFLHLKETDILHDVEPCNEDDFRGDLEETDQTKNGSIDNSSSCVDFGILTEIPHDVTESLVSKHKWRGGGVGDGPRKPEPQGKIKEHVQRLLMSVNDKHASLEMQDVVDTPGSLLVGLDQVEPWEDLCCAKDWVTSPLHPPKIENIFSSPKDNMQGQATLSSIVNILKMEELPHCKDSDVKKSVELRDITLSQTKCSGKPTPELEITLDLQTGKKWEGINLASESVELKLKKEVTKLEIPRFNISKSLNNPNEAVGQQNVRKGKQKSFFSSQRIQGQMSHEAGHIEKPAEISKPKLRPYSLNLDLGQQEVRELLNYGHSLGAAEAKLGSSLELEFFLSSPKAPLRRNSAPVSVSSVRTPFMIKTSQAKSVPVVPPKIQYSLAPQTLPETKTSEKSTDQVIQITPERKLEKGTIGNSGSLYPTQKVRDQRDLHRVDPFSKVQRHKSMNNATYNENYRPGNIMDLPVLRRKRSANGDTFTDRSRPQRSDLLQRSSFRNRPRPQSLILFSPPFPIMDYHVGGEDAKQPLSPIAAETSPFDAYANELVENLKTTEGVTLRNKMTLPKSGQRLETSTSCFYQPQRRSMIFDNRGNRQND